MSGPSVAAGGANAPSSSRGFVPLRHRVYAMLWAATVLGNTGTFVRDGATSWLVRNLSRAPAVPPSCKPPARFPTSFSPYDWVGARASALAIYLMVFNGAMAAGSIVRGSVASRCAHAARRLRLGYRLPRAENVMRMAPLLLPGATRSKRGDPRATPSQSISI